LGEEVCIAAFLFRLNDFARFKKFKKDRKDGNVANVKNLSTAKFNKAESYDQTAYRLGKAKRSEK